MLIFYIGSFFTLNGNNFILIGIYMLMLLNNRRNVSDLVFAIVALILSFANLFFEYNLIGIT